MTQENKNIKYFLYARKSSEDKERQIHSNEDQISRLKEVAVNLGLDIKKIYTETKSAKKPYNRPVFEEMLQKIEEGEADGILCWQINRLSRNPVDSGKINWLLQQGIIRSIQTIDRQYLPNDNVLIFSVESGVANQFILDLKQNVGRGIRRKLEEGWKPGSAPMGYKNDLTNHTIVKDKERFFLLRKAWDLILTGNYNVPQILDKLNNEWGFRTIKKKKTGGKQISRSKLYQFFSDPFYAGIIVHKEKHYPGKHKAMVTLEEYERVQEILGIKRKGKPQKHKFAFTGFIRCAECGCLITAQNKYKLLLSGERRKHTYYHCTRRKKHVNCSQRKGLREDSLELQVLGELKKYTILPEFREWAFKILEEENNREAEKRNKIYDNQRRTIVKAERELDQLTKMRYRELIDDETFLKEKETLQMQILRLKENLRENKNKTERWIDLTEKTLDFATYAHKAFSCGELERKKEILMALGENLTIKGGELKIQPYEWLQPIAEYYPLIEKTYLMLEPGKIGRNKAKTDAFTSVRTQWQGRQDSNLKQGFWRPL